MAAVAPAAASTGAAPDAARTAALRAWAHEQARRHCTPCHVRSLPDSKPRALAIFDLEAPAWSATISPERLRAGFTRRLNGRLDESGRQQLRAFVEAEIAGRSP